MIIKKWMFLCLFIIAAIVLSAGCITTRIPAVSKPVPPAVFVDYHRTGGIAGLDERLVVFDNGMAVISGKSGSSELELNATDLARITALFDKAEFSGLQTNYPAPRGSADLIGYSVSYHGKTVTTEDTAIPPGLQPVLSALNHILDNTAIPVTEYPTLNIRT
ncbi:MAG: hypothetical protein ABFC71_01930 [Methanoregula sp.]|jgi:hypothetical protein